MRTISRSIKIELLNFSELSDEEQQLVFVAKSVRRRAQAPYSHYFVGAAIRSESGEIYEGCNVENVSYTQTTHAEQTAVTSMVAAEGPVKIQMMAIVGAPEGVGITIVQDVETNSEARVEDFCFACGHCLQIVWENCLADPNVPLLLLTPWGEVARTTIGNAFPMPFGPEILGVNIKGE